ncbi:type II toxin-antitoxin system RelE/ParE family toxin [Duganella radicis]|uniref:Type II toxin-antitoxin system RelE/ParE family toxin n=1 Tax=Duganella radicis TaxID=551988 RepID=A0A6L6PHC1_9BURK|nr:type II toxin-antitoxin system RelE/ParE family toxin [Duganella radicis]MTV38450.1 type II toxin-antitoxin system RelE/ParE family toxin [Duganella radicis]
MNLIIAPAALAELQDAADFYAAHGGLNLAQAFITEFERVANLVQSNPLLGATYQRKWHRYFLSKFPFTLVYQIRADELVILAVAHNRRRPGYWKKRR